MPIKSTLKDSLDDFYKFSEQYSGNEYEDDFEDQDGGLSDRVSPIDTTESKRRVNGTTNRSSSPAFERVRNNLTSNGTNRSHGTPRKRTAFSETLGSDRREGSEFSYASRRTEPRSTGYGKTGRRKVQRGKQPRPAPRKNENVTKRVLSASRNKMNALQNILAELQNEVQQLKLENKDLKRTARLQEKEIRKLDNDEAELPSLLQKHNEEMRTMREQIRRQRETGTKLNEELRRRDLEVIKLKDKLQRCEEIIQDKKLNERDRLNQKVDELQADLEEKQKKITDLEKSISLQEKSRNRDFKERNQKYKQALSEIKTLEEQQRELLVKLKEKEKELDVKNIYSQSIALKKKHNALRLPFLDSPNTSPKSERKSSSSRSDATKSKSPGSSTKSPGQPVFLTSGARKKSDDTRIVTRDDTISSEEGASFGSQSPLETLVSGQRRREEELERQREQEREERERKMREEVKREVEEKLRREEEKKRREEERKLKEIEERLKKQEELKEIEERLKRQEELALKEKLEEEERKKREAAEKNRQEEEQRKLEELKKKEESLRREGATAVTEAERKKELLLARMRAIDEGKNPNNINLSNLDNELQNRKKKLIFLQSENDRNPTAKEDDTRILPHDLLDFSLQPKRPIDQKRDTIVLSSNPFDFSSPKTKSLGVVNSDGSGTPDEDPFGIGLSKPRRRGSKDHQFRQADENLHKGLPSHADLSSGSERGSAGKSRSKRNDDFVFGSYLPSAATGKSGSAGRSKPKDLQKTNSEEENFPFFGDKPSSKPVVKKEDPFASGFVFGNTGDATDSLHSAPFGPSGGRRQGRQKQVSNVFGDDLFSDETKTLPKSDINDLFSGKTGSTKPFTLDSDVDKKPYNNDLLFSAKKTFGSQGRSSPNNPKPVKTIDSSFIDDDIEEMVLS